MLAQGTTTESTPVSPVRMLDYQILYPDTDIDFNKECTNTNVSGTLCPEETNKSDTGAILMPKEEEKLGLALSDIVVEPFIHITCEPLDEKILSEKSAIYPRPANAKTLKVPRLNGWLQEVTPEIHKQLDRDLQQVQSYMVASMSAVAGQAQTMVDLKHWAMNSIHCDKSQTFEKSYTALMDANILLTRAMYDTNQFRRELIKPCMTNSLMGLLISENKTTSEWLAEDISASMTGVKAGIGNELSSAANTKNNKHADIKSDEMESLPAGIPTVDTQPFDSLEQGGVREKNDDQVCTKLCNIPLDGSNIKHSSNPKHENVIKCFTISEVGTDTVFDESKSLETNENLAIVPSVESEVLEKVLDLPNLPKEEQHAPESGGSVEFLLPSVTDTCNTSTGMGEAPYVCLTCGKAFQRPRQLKDHMRTHTKEKPACLECGKMLCSFDSLKSHMRTHTGEKPYICDDCGNGFCESSGLKRHILLYHADDKSHICTECSKGFSQIEGLTRHMKSHTRARPYKCADCDKAFSAPGSLKNHKKIHTDERHHACTVCGLKFLRYYGLKSHMMTHTGEKPHLCSVCNRRFSRALTLTTHMDTHKRENTHICPDCDQTFRKRAELLTHIKETHKLGKAGNSTKGSPKLSQITSTTEPETVNPHVCLECGESFSQLDSLAAHMLSHTLVLSDNMTQAISEEAQVVNSAKLHNRSEKEQGDSDGTVAYQLSSPEDQAVTDADKEPNVGNTMGEEFIQLSNVGIKPENLLTAVLQSVVNPVEKPHVCSVCSKAFEFGSLLKAHMKTHSVEKPHVCDECGKGFNWLHTLRVHMKVHSGGNSFACIECGEEFSVLSELKSHRKRHRAEHSHTGDKVVCPDCGKSLVGTLKDHMRTHTGEKPFKCMVCSKAFNQSANLRVHMLIHTGEKPHLCAHCGKGFRTLAHLNNHIRIHTGERPYKCSYCSSAFNEPNNLKKHIRTHTGEKPFVCEECGKTFLCRTYLKTHMRTHTGEKPFACSDCGKRFSMNTSLQKHIRTHTGVRPYVCKECSKGFNTSWHLKEHTRTHTGEKPFMCPQCSKAFSDAGSLKKTHKDTCFKNNKRDTPSGISVLLNCVIYVTKLRGLAHKRPK